jgi:tetratricopeptide (TPR) repeat protein
MNRSAGKTALAIALATSMLALAGCNKLKARDELNKGVQAYKQSKFEQAIEHFKNATDRDPQLTVARLYLATAYVAQYVPGNDTPENNRFANGAIDQFKKVLESNEGAKSTRVLSTKGLASLYFNMKDFEQAKMYDKKAIELDPNDPENYYSVSVVDWTQSYVPRQEARARLGLSNNDKFWKTKDGLKACEEFKAKDWDRVQEGVTMLQKAIDLRKDYDDAMAYLNLLYRERADLQCGDDAARDADLKSADEWVEKTMATKKAKAEKQNEQHGIVLEEKKPEE